MKLSWKPIRRGEIYCSPACGDKRKEEIMRQINDPDFKLAMKDIMAEKINVDNLSQF